MRPPRLRTTRRPRRLACGCHVPAGVTIAGKGRSWLCARHQPWLHVPTVAEILARERGERIASR